MSKLNEIQQRLSEIDATKFHKLVDSYLSKKYNYSIHSTGTKTGEDKPRKGTPDTLITLDNGRYIFVEYTTQKTKIKDKFKDDIKKCLEPKKTDIEISKIDKIILACNSSLQSNDIESLKQACKDIKCEVITNSTLSYDLVNHYPTIAKDFWGIDINNMLTVAFLKDRYKSEQFRKLRPLSSLNKDIYLENIYQDLSIIKRAKNKDEKDEEITIDKILDNSKKVSILGKSGIGKSTLSKYICYQWANGQLFNDYEYLFYIPIKKWEKGEGIFDVILKVLKKSINENIKLKASDLSQYIENFDNTTLFVIDGFDEINSEYKEEIIEDIQNLNNYIITSRHEGLNNSNLNIEETFYNEGFNQKSIENFIKYIPNSNELLKQINSNNQLKELSKIPMLLDMICYLYKKNQIDFNSHFTMTSLYEKFLDEIIFRFEKERKVQSNKITKEDDDIFFELGRIAFDNLKDKNFRFKGTFITRSNRKFIENELLPFGFITNLTNERHSKDRKYEFIHNSFQEYFSAYYVSTLSKELQSEIIQAWKFYSHMQMFFAFLGGLIGDKEFLLEEIKSNPMDILGIYETFLLADCLNEIKNDINQDFIIKIFKSMIEWLEYSIRDEHLYYKLFKPIIQRFKNYPYFHTEYMFETLYKLILEYSEERNHNLIVTIVEDLAYLLPIFIKNDDSFLQKVNKILNNNKISIYTKSSMVRGFSFYSKDNVPNELIQLIQEKQEDIDYRCWLSKILIVIDSNNIEYINIIMEFLKVNIHNINFDIFNILKNSLISTNEKEVLRERFMDILIENIQLNDLYISVIQNTMEILQENQKKISKYNSNNKTEESFYSAHRKDDEYIAILEKELENEKDNRNRYIIAKKLYTLKRTDKKYIDILMNSDWIFIPDIFHKSILSKKLIGFEKIFNADIDYAKKKACLDTNLDIKVLFEAYDNKYDIKNFLLSNLIYSNKALYFNSENQLCTIENGERITTQREIDINILKAFPKAKESIEKQFLEKRKNTKLTSKAKIITEGKTDWKHLKKALERFQIIYGEYIDLNIEFFEYENMGMGEARVINRIEVESFIDRHLQEQNKQKILCMFDRDTKYSKDYRDKEFIKPIDKEFKNFLDEKLAKKYKRKSKKYKDIKEKLDKGFYSDIDKEFHKILTGEEYKEWQRLSNSNVYVFCIPKINDELNEICIEFYYKQDEVKKAFDNGKRLFYGSEFDKDSISYCKKYKTTKPYPKPLDILDGSGNKKVYLINDEKKQNIALSKNEFTQNILDEVEGFDNFDIENFRLIFDVIRKIVND